MSSPCEPSKDPAAKKSPSTIEQICAQITTAVEACNFQEAERLRDELIATDPLAISEAIKTAELIEKAMSATIDKEHVAIWPELYDQLTIEERNCLFHSMDKYVLPERRMLLKYGSLNNRLFFIEKGQVTVAIPQGEKQFKVVAQLGRGDVLGEYTFATIALCSATAVTKTPVQIRCLEGTKAEGWEDKQPGLLNKVMDFCLKHGQIETIAERKETESHTHQRYHVPGKVKAVLLDKSGQETEVVFNGELEEMSRSGASFAIHCKKRETVKQLLTRSFALRFVCGEKGREISFSTVGKVVRVSFLLYNDYLLHIGFHKALPAELDARLTP